MQLNEMHDVFIVLLEKILNLLFNIYIKIKRLFVKGYIFYLLLHVYSHVINGLKFKCR
jgi:hypothetical protein